MPSVKLLVLATASASSAPPLPSIPCSVTLKTCALRVEGADLAHKGQQGMSIGCTGKAAWSTQGSWLVSKLEHWLQPVLAWFEVAMDDSLCV